MKSDNALTTLGTRQLLLERANCFKRIRNYFEQKNVIEVDTRLLDLFSVTDPYMNAMKVSGPNDTSYFLQTSPEYAMKRLLALGSGDIYQLNKAFRAEEEGQHHSSEFTMLEWYRVGFSLAQLMEDVYQLIICLLGDKEKRLLTYREAFEEVLAIDPLNISTDQLEQIARKQLGDIPTNLLHDNYLTLLFSEKIEPSFPKDQVTFVYHYPQSQAALAKTQLSHGILVAERFEVYLDGLELANGFNELTDPQEQLNRFKEDNLIRQQLKLPTMAIDERLINALSSGLPECSGVALGVDRLLMLKLAQPHISQVLPLG